MPVKAKKKIHPKVKAATGGGAAAYALVEIAAWAGINLPLAVAGAVVVLAVFAGGYLKSS